MFQKTMRLSTLVGVLISSLATVKVNGSCSNDVEEIYKKEAIEASFQSMVNTYAEKCIADNSCQFSNYEGTVVAVNKLIADSGGPEDFNFVDLLDFAPDDPANLDDETLSGIEDQVLDEFSDVDTDKLVELLGANPPPLKLDASIDATSFTEDQSYVAYVTECNNLKPDAKITLVDVEFKAQGDDTFKNILASQFSSTDGFLVDVDIKMMGIPLCLSSSCDDEEDLSDVADTLLSKLAVEFTSQADDVPGDINLDQVVALASFSNFCNFGKADGLDECSFTVKRVAAENIQLNTSDGKSKKTFVDMITAVITLTSVLLL